MCRSSPFVITLPDADRAELERRARCYTLPHAVVVRAKIVLLAAAGLENTQIAARLDVHVNVVSRWRGRFAREGLDGLGDRRRPGRPGVSRRGGRGGQGDGLRAAGRPPGAAVAVVRGGAGRRGPGGGPDGVGGAVDGVAVAGGGRDPAVAVPVVDLPPRPGLRGQGRAGAGLVPADLGGP